MATQNNVVGWFEIHVADMARARAFYQQVIQREMSDLPGSPDMQMCAFNWLDSAQGASGALVKSDSMRPGVGGTMVYFSCDDCAVEASRVPGAGGRLLQPKMSIDQYGFIAIAQDTEGNIFGLHSRT